MRPDLKYSKVDINLWASRGFRKRVTHGYSTSDEAAEKQVQGDLVSYTLPIEIRLVMSESSIYAQREYKLHDVGLRVRRKNQVES